MGSYTFVSILALASYLFLFFSFMASRKGPLIRSYMAVLISLIIWTGGSFLMRCQFLSKIDVWYHISIFGLFLCLTTMYRFVSVLVHVRHKFQVIATSIGAIICTFLNVRYELFLPPPTVSIIDGYAVFTYEPGSMAYILFFGVVICVGDIIYILYKSIASEKENLKQISPFILGTIILIIGHLFVLLPVFDGFPIDILSGIFFAICMYYMVYKRQLFKLTLLVSRINCYIISAFLSILVFIYLMTPINRIIVGIFRAYPNIQNLLISITFTTTTLLIYYIFVFFTNKFFIKHEKRQVESLKQFTQSVAKTLDMDYIVKEIIDVVQDVTLAKEVNFAILNKENNEYRIKSQKDYFVYPSISASSSLFEFLNDTTEAVPYQSFKNSLYYRSLWKKEKDELQDMDIQYMVPFRDEELMGVLFLSTKERGDYKHNDFDFLSSLTSVAVMALKNAQLYQRVYLEARTDELTGLYNRKYFYELLGEIYDNSPNMLSLVHMSIDDFRLYNQLYGNVEGDYVLIEIASIIKNSIGANCIGARLQGKEFAIILPEFNLLQAKNLCENIRQQIMQLNKKSTINAKVITASFGVASIPQNASSVSQLLEYADHALYQAKKDGKNCVHLYNVDSTKSISNPSKQDSAYEQYASTIYALTATIHTKDHYTFTHSNNVGYYAVALAKRYGLSKELVEMIKEAALLHDIGKIGIPEHILNKKGRLDQEEFEIMKSHVDNSIDIIKHLPSLEYVIPAVISHHERYDGHGYPRRIAGEDIPLAGRILCIADSFDAMMSRRVYKEACTVDYAIGELISQSNKQFDPKLVTLFIELIESNTIELQIDNSSK